MTNQLIRDPIVTAYFMLVGIHPGHDIHKVHTQLKLRGPNPERSNVRVRILMIRTLRYT